MQRVVGVGFMSWNLGICLVVKHHIYSTEATGTHSVFGWQKNDPTWASTANSLPTAMGLPMLTCFLETV